MRLIIVCLVMLAAAPVWADHALKIPAGAPWQMMVRHQSGNVPWTAPGRYLAVISADSGIIACMRLEQSSVDPATIMLSLTVEQLAALSGRKSQWELMHLPDIGQPFSLIKGTIEVNP